MRRQLSLRLAPLLVALLVAGCAGETEPATDVTLTSAKLHANVSWEQGESGHFWWEYRCGGASTWTQSGGGPFGPMSSAGSAPISHTVTGLPANSTCQFRLVADLDPPDTAIWVDSQGDHNGTNYDAFTTGSVNWKADAETPGSWQVTSTDPGPEWASTTERAGRPWMTERVHVSTHPQGVKQGSYAYRFECRNGDYGQHGGGTDNRRCELAQGNPGRAGFENRLSQPGQDEYLGFWLKHDTLTLDGGWQLGGIQHKTIAPSGWPEFEAGLCSPPYSCQNTMSFANKRGHNNTVVEDRMGQHAIRLGVWRRYIVRLKHEPEPNGVIQVWRKDVDASSWTMLVNKNNAYLQYATNPSQPMHTRIGIYEDETGAGPDVYYIDGFVSAKTFAQAVAELGS